MFIVTELGDRLKRVMTFKRIHIRSPISGSGRLGKDQESYPYAEREKKKREPNPGLLLDLQIMNLLLCSDEW